MPRKAKPAGSKSQFIRDRLSLSAAETIKQAKAAGISISPAMVYSVRAETKKKGAAPSAPRAQASAPVKGGSLEQIIRGIVREEIKAFFANR